MDSRQSSTSSQFGPKGTLGQLHKAALEYDMEVKAQDQIAFYLTGQHNGSGLKPLEQGYRPALFARYADLSALRYDFPIVLNTDGSPDRAILSLSGLVDDAVEALDDKDRDRVAQQGYQIEREVRKELSHLGGRTNGTTTDFKALWNAAATRLALEDLTVADSAKRLWDLFKARGELVDVEFALPSRAARHVWSVVQASKTKAFRAKADRLLLKLHGILDAELASSDRGRSPERLKAGIAAQDGTSFATTFDFDLMSRLLIEAKPGIALSESRRKRIQGVIDVLEGQRFYEAPRSQVAQDAKVHSFVFYNCADALQAYKERRREAVDLLKALAIAELEVNGEYRESGKAIDTDSTGAPSHDSIFEDFGIGGLDASLLATLPDYLVCKNSSELSAEESLQIVEALSTGLPIRVVVQTDDLLEPSAIGRATLAVPERHLALASRSRQMLDTAISLTDVFVLQSSASQLFRLRDALLRGMSYSGPAFFSVFSGSTGHNGDVPAYLVAAAAVESRAFPTIVFDPAAGADWATRLVIDDNPSPEDGWPVHAFEYESATHQSCTEQVAFTLADFIAMDDRFREHFAIVPEGDWNDAMIAIPESLRLKPQSLPNSVPFITLIDSGSRMMRAIVNRRAFEETRRSQNLWRSLQELGGINNSHAALAERLAEARAEERHAEQIRALGAAPALTVQPVIEPTAAPAQPVMVAEVAVAIVEESHGDDPYIETSRCTTCNECTQVNNKMFAYNAEKQAHIADPSAGTFRQLVEAAEGCQVSIIHPGKPRNPKEPGLEDLLIRAAQFN
ncbi:MAG: ferredoxin [Bacteroidota bacterium]|nr:ferredoxin [Bacteroidota bacterium]MDP4232152.1 ferredoxin [Bacteroidota bacterium]MDP4241140.1 ferredoxin [Bacteroidota bacterium]MDP4286532.1 ferredoxin [Bacteroidota bacterium]